jgi:hypothetical protein
MFTAQHEETGHCYACGQDWELEPGDQFVVICGECFHLWRTPSALQGADLAAAVRASEPDELVRLRIRELDEIRSCPCCVHDF